MRAYSAADEEALRALRLLKDWEGEGFLSKPQRQSMEQDAECALRRTNGFLRLVLFLFTLISVAAATGLFLVFFSLLPDSYSAGVVLLFFAAICYAGVEFAVSRAHLYRHGIEEALAVLSIIFLCWGLQATASRGHVARQDKVESLVPAAGAIASFLIYRRFGFQYMFLAAMIFAAFTPHYWTTSQTGQHLILAGFFTAGLIAVGRVRETHRLDYLDGEYSVVEASLWLGLYLTMNLQLSLANLLAQWQPGPVHPLEFSKAFYWTSYAVIWCLPVVMLWRAMKMKDRTVTGLGVIVAILTLVTNKPYLGWQRHPWDPMLLGLTLTGVAVAVRHWLTSRPAGVRHGFTAQRLSGRDKLLMNAVSATLGIALPSAGTLTPPSGSEPRFGGGSPDGGGASSDY